MEKFDFDFDDEMNVETLNLLDLFDDKEENPPPITIQPKLKSVLNVEPQIQHLIKIAPKARKSEYAIQMNIITFIEQIIHTNVFYACSSEFIKIYEENKDIKKSMEDESFKKKMWDNIKLLSGIDYIKTHEPTQDVVNILLKQQVQLKSKCDVMLGKDKETLLDMNHQLNVSSFTFTFLLQEKLFSK